MVACRSRGAAPTRCQATASAIAALGPLADVAVDGGRQTLPSLTPNLCLSRLIQESSGFWYRFQLLRLLLYLLGLRPAGSDQASLASPHLDGLSC